MLYIIHILTKEKKDQRNK